MIDFHSHILPNMDDGSSSLEESTALLQMLSQQGADIVFATSHFYANHESVAEFLNRRQKAFEILKSQLPENMPEIRLGAEVRYYEGISRLEKLDSLCIQGTKLLLLEMSASHWSEYTVRELASMAGSGKVLIVLVHIERYFDYQSKETWKRLVQSGILMQVNASFFADFRTARRAIRLLKNRYVHFVGSDCHDLKIRPPRMAEAAERINRKVGPGYFAYMTECEAELLGITSS